MMKAETIAVRILKIDAELEKIGRVNRNTPEGARMHNRKSTLYGARKKLGAKLLAIVESKHVADAGMLN